MKIVFSIIIVSTSNLIAQLNFNIALKNYNEGNYNDAIYWSTKSLETNTEDAYKAYTIRGMAKAKLGDYRGSDLDLFESLKIKPRDVEAYYNISLNYLFQKKYDLSQNYVDTAISLSEPVAYLHNHKSTLYSEIGDYTNAIIEENIALNLNPNDAESNENMGWYQFKLSNYRESIKYNNIALLLAPENSKTLINRAYAYTEVKEYDSAITDLETVILRLPNSPILIAKKGEIRYLQGKFIEACNNFEDVKVLNDTMGLRYINTYCDNREVTNHYPNGKISHKLTYKNGIRIGKEIEYFENGKVFQEFPYLNGKATGKFSKYYNNGKIEITGTLVEEIQQGTWTQYYLNGNIKEKGNYINSLTNGEWLKNYENGKLHFKIEMKDGKKHGKYIEYYENGTLKEDSNFKNGLPDGEYKLYYENGKLKQEGNIFNGEEYGEPKKCDEQGNILKE